MLHSFDAVTVQILSEGNPLKFYHDPDENPNNPSPSSRQYYVEAVTDATFKVRIVLSNKFPLYRLRDDDAVRLSINYDGQQLWWYTDLSTSHLIQCWSKGQSTEHTFARLSRYCDHSQRWTSGETTFGALHTSRLFVLSLGRAYLTEYAGDTAASVAEVKDLGKIRVTVRRVHRMKRASPLHTPKDRLHKPLSEVSEKTLKGRAIANTVRYYISALAPYSMLV